MKFNNILITGGAGFIGSNLIRYIFEKTDFSGRIINLDKLTYAGNPLNIADIEQKEKGKRYFFEHGDICDFDNNVWIFKQYDIDAVIHLAAESHVDRSILGPGEFIRTNINGTFALLAACRSVWKDRKDVRFHHVNTDEVFGSLGATGYFTETTPYDPRSPYSSSKASSDHLVRAYFHTYGLPITLTNCSNNYGSYQYNMRDRKPLPVYGDGKNIRDWLYVEDHNSAVWAVLQNGKVGESYNIGGENEWENIKLVNTLCEIFAQETGSDEAEIKRLITFVKDRPGHDRRYAIDCSKLKRELGWKQSVDFGQGLIKTVRWYLDNIKWAESIRSGEYLKWIEKNYKDR